MDVLVRGRLTSLRPAGAADVDRLVSWHADPEVSRYWDGETFTRDEVEDRLVRGDVEAWIVEERRVPVGYLQVHPDGLDMFLIPSARGRGLGPDAARAMAEHLLHERGRERLTVDPYAWNEGAVRAWQRAGFVEISRHEADAEHTAPWILMGFADQSASGSSSAFGLPSSGSGAGDSSISSFLSSSRGCISLAGSMKVVLPDSSELELPDGASGLDAARAIGTKLAEQAVLVRANGRVQDLRLPLQDGEPIQILTTRDKDDPDALAVLRHSSAHLLAEAVTGLYPGVKLAIGPPIEQGFYYDFDFPEPIREEDLEKIQAAIDRELAQGREWSREEISRDEARQRFAGDPYKLELVDTAEGEITLYRQHGDGGDFTDLCRGPHLQNSKPIKALKLTGLAGAYWRGDSSKPQLTRIYGTAFYSREDLDAHLERLERARTRDHRRLGPQLDLFHMSEYSPGAALWTAKGMAIYNALEDLRRRENAKRGYSEVKTPLMWDVELWKRSGHWEKYGDNLFRIEQGESVYGLKPMNCPGHMLLFNSQLRSYRDLPIRYAEAAVLHRDEPTGSLQGLTRARQFSQDDAHVFCMEDQIQEEIDAMFDYVDFLYDTFGVRELAHAELATRPDNKLGTDEQWDHTEGVLRRALERIGLPYRVAEGEGAFYGPKIDFFMDDALGRPWQMGTIQLDGQQPERLGCTYMGSDNREHTPYVIHRALFGSLERFIGILLEHYGGDLPFWLAPVQVRILPVGEAHLEAAQDLAGRLTPFRVEVAEPVETIGKRIRAAELDKIPFTVVYGDRESDESLAVRERGGEQSNVSLAELLARLEPLLPSDF